MPRSIAAVTVGLNDKSLQSRKDDESARQTRHCGSNTGKKGGWDGKRTEAQLRREDL